MWVYKFDLPFVLISGKSSLQTFNPTKQPNQFIRTKQIKFMNKDISLFTLCNAMEVLCDSLKNGENPQKHSIPDELKSPLFSETDILVMAWLENHRYEDHTTDEICKDLEISADVLEASMSHLEVNNILVGYMDDSQEINLAVFFACILDRDIKNKARNNKKPDIKILWESYMKKLDD